MSSYMIEHRKRTLIPTAGSKRRCYDGYFPSNDWEEGWTAWSFLELGLSLERAKERLEDWNGLSLYAAKERKTKISTEYRIVLDTISGKTL
jgi:hypothetical protein